MSQGLLSRARLLNSSIFGSEDGIKITGQGKSVANYYENITKGNLVTIRRHFGFDTLVKLANPSTLPSNQIRDIAFSPDDTFLAIGASSSPGVFIYKRNGDVFTKLANPSTVFVSTVYGVSFSPDGKYLVATGSSNSNSSNPSLILYKISGDTFTPVQVWTGSTGMIYDVKFSPNSKYIAFYDTGTSSQLKIYSVNTDDTLTYVASATGAGTSVVSGKMSWSYDGSYIAIAYQSASNIKVFSFNGTTLTTQTIPSLTTGTSNSCACAFHPSDNTLLAVCDLSANILLLRRSGTTFTIENTLAIAGAGKSCYWSSDGMYISAVSYNSPYIETYKKVGSTYIKMANPSVLPPNGCTDIAFGNLNSYVAVGNVDTPYILVYKADILGDYAYIYDSLSDLYVGNYINFGYAKTTGLANDTNKEIITLPFKI